MPSAKSIWPILVFLAGVLIILIQFWWEERRRKTLQAEASRKFTEASLLQQRELHAQFQAQQQALFNSMIEGVLLVDQEHRVLMVNESLRHLFTFPAEIRGKPMAQVFRLPLLDGISERLNIEKKITDFELELPSIPPRCVRINAALVLDQGRPQGEIFVFHDVTQLKQLENMRRDFVANVSHELRTPLSLIHGFTETLLDGAKDDPQTTTRFLQKIDNQSHRLLFLIEDLLTISKLESGKIALNIQAVNLHQTARKVLEDLASQAASNQTALRNEIPADLTVEADGERLQQVFYNLIENAIKYGRQEGRVIISARLLPGKTEVSVTDNGPGIPAESCERIFERFYRVDRARSRATGGTGLGLSIVKHIVQAHGGEVWVQSPPNSGTTFSFTLPTNSGRTSSEP